MAYSTLGNIGWGSSPQIPITFQYDYQRSGADMQYKIKITVGTITGSSYFGYPIYTSISLDGATKVSGYTIKNAYPSQWASAIVYESDWLTVSGKGSGTTTLTIRTYSGSGSSRDNTVSYSLYVSPAATTPTLSATSADIGDDITITMNRASSSFTHTLWYRFNGGSWVIIASNLATSYTWTIPNVASSIPNATSGTMEIWCSTYENGVEIGNKTVSLTATVPSTFVPTISNVSILEGTDGLAEQFGAFVQNKSTLSVSIIASGSNGSTISSYTTYIQSIAYREASFTSNAITESGTINVLTSVTDSRGRTAQVSNSISVEPYSPPRISEFSAWRITNGGVASEDGNRIAMKINYSISPVGYQNSKTYNFKYKRSTDSEFTSFGSGIASWEYDETQYRTNEPDISTDYAYIIRIEISDYFQTVAYEVQIPTAFTLMDFRNTGKGMAIGKVSEKDALEIAMETDLRGGLYYTQLLHVSGISASSAFNSVAIDFKNRNLILIAFRWYGNIFQTIFIPKALFLTMNALDNRLMVAGVQGSIELYTDGQNVYYKSDFNNAAITIYGM